MLNQYCLFDNDQELGGSLFSFPSNTLSPYFGSCTQNHLFRTTFTTTTPPSNSYDPSDSSSAAAAAEAAPLPPSSLSESPNLLKHELDILSPFQPPQILSLQTSTANLWSRDDLSEGMIRSSKRMNGSTTITMDHHHHHGISGAIKMKKFIKGRRKVREPRFCFKTLSDVDVLDDGYKWRKYGQKVVKNTQHPRSYYRCTQDKCRVKKRIERLADDPRMVITTYEGRHIHSPSHDHDNQDEYSHSSSSHLNTFFCM